MEIKDNKKEHISTGSRTFAKMGFSHLLIYLGFMTTLISVPKETFLLNRFLYIILVVGLGYYFSIKKIIFNKYILIFFIAILITSLYSAFNGTSITYLVFRAFFGILGISALLFSYFAHHKYSNEKLIEHYINIILIVCYIGIVQEFSFLIRFRPGYDFAWILIWMPYQDFSHWYTGGIFMRINSIFTEPGYLACALSPAVFLAIHKLFNSENKYLTKKQAILILITISLTFSSIGYIGTLFSIILNLKRKAILIALIALPVLVVLVLNVGDVKSRINGLSTIVANEVSGYENATSLLTAVNYYVTVDNFQKKPIIGSGLDAYQFAFDKTLKTYSFGEGLEKFIAFMPEDYMFKEDGGNMIFKVTVEMGIFGIILILFYYWKYRTKSGIPESIMLQKMSLVFVFTYSFRTGQYVRFELWYFIALYYSVWRNDLNRLLLKDV